jgi:sporulation protein YlmC with PRC-barrel domain
MRILLSLGAISLMTGLAAAQTTAPAADPPAQRQPAAQDTIKSPSQTTPTVKGGKINWYQRVNDDWPASELIGATVRNPAGENIGEVNELILARDGKVRAVIIGVGGFLGMGERDVAVSFDSVEVTLNDNNDEIVTVDATKDTLNAAPEWQRMRTGG